MRGKSLLAIAAVTTVALAGGIASATIPDSGGLIHACFKNENGQLRVIDSGDCGPNEAALTWNQTGSVGPPGPQGDPGPTGPSGTLAWAYVDADGTVLRSSGNVTVVHLFPGQYCVGVTGSTVHAAMAVLDSHANRGGTIQTGVFFASGCPAGHNIWVVTRPQFQDGGLPGVDRAYYLVVS
jgi:hypothetical protein